MRRSRLKLLLGHAVGLFCYFGGMIVFLFVALDVFLSSPEGSIENVTNDHVAWLAVSVVLIVGGRVISWRLGGERALVATFRGNLRRRSPEQSRLRELGYNVPAETDPDRQFEYEDGDVYVVCEQCGASNEQGYSYCSNCSADLPE